MKATKRTTMRDGGSSAGALAQAGALVSAILA